MQIIGYPKSGARVFNDKEIKNNNLALQQLKTILKNILLFSALFLTIILRGQPSVPERPSPPRLVNDFAGLLSASENGQLESTLSAYNDSSSNQIAIVTLKSLGDYAIEDWALEIGRKWGVGKKAKNNGVLIIISLEPRKINISPGYGLEGALPDITCKRIISNEMVPSMKYGQYYTALSNAVTAIRSVVKGEYVNEDKGQQSGEGGFWFFVIILIIILIAFIFIANSRRSAAYYGPNRRRHIDNSGGGWIFWGGGGGSGWGGGGGSDNSGGGGFGGFGGGDFGGGGASGDW